MKKEILIVDDEDLVISLLTKVLTMAGYSVDSAQDGITALKKVKLKKYVLVILDVKLPDINGFHVCRRIKASPELYSIPVIMITGYTEYFEEFIKNNSGAEELVMKPFSNQQIVDLARRYTSGVREKVCV